MAERRNYRSAAPAAKTPYEDEDVEQDAGAEEEEERPAPRRTFKKKSRDEDDGKFVTVTGLFPTKSGKADTAYVKDDMYELIRKIRPGDTIGVSMNAKTNRLQFWYITKG